MSTPGSRATATASGLIIMLLAASVGMHSGAGRVVLVLCFAGIVAGAILFAVGVRDPLRTIPVSFARRNTASVGILMASCAFTAVSGEAGPVLCFAMFVLLLFGVTLITIGAPGE